jgi:hypothetical protein
LRQKKGKVKFCKYIFLNNPEPYMDPEPELNVKSEPDPETDPKKEKLDPQH